jgi:translation initiation factor IF-3
MRQIEEFLRKKNQVRFVVVFHGRENQHKDMGIDILNNTAKRMAEIATVDGNMQSMGNRMFITLIPKN